MAGLVIASFSNLSALDTTRAGLRERIWQCSSILQLYVSGTFYSNVFQYTLLHWSSTSKLWRCDAFAFFEWILLAGNVCSYSALDQGRLWQFYLLEFLRHSSPPCVSGLITGGVVSRVDLSRNFALFACSYSFIFIPSIANDVWSGAPNGRIRSVDPVPPLSGNSQAGAVTHIN